MHTLPTQLTPLIGREAQIKEVRELLLRPNVRLVTLTGVGGTGKTRLGIQVANTLIPEFEDGVYFVPLAAISDPGFVISAIATRLGLQESGGESFASLLKSYLRDKRLLLVLDNFEQVLGAAPLISEVLAEAPAVKLLVTSRARLHVPDEHMYTVPPLTLPDLKSLPDLVPLSQYETVALFIARARAINPDFHMTSGNAPAIAEICTRLDGLPLAIELAAARTNVLSPEAALARLRNRKNVLSRGPRDAPVRHQTLYAAIDWSHELLEPDEQKLFRRLAVFAGGCTLESARIVCNERGDIGLGMSDGLTSLVDKNLLKHEVGKSDEPRYAMLETIREYAWDRLTTATESDETGRAHVAYFLDTCEQAAAVIERAQQQQWLERIDAELGNLRLALRRAIDAKDDDTALRLCVATYQFWRSRGYNTEARQWFKQALACAPGPASGLNDLRAEAMRQAAHMAYDQEDVITARQLCNEGLHITEKKPIIARLLNTRAQISWSEGKLSDAIVDFDQGISLAKDSDDKATLSKLLNNKGALTNSQGNYAEAEKLYTQSKDIDAELQDLRGVAISLFNIGTVAFRQEQYSRAADFYTESLALCDRLGARTSAAYALGSLGFARLGESDLASAQTCFERGLQLAKEIDNLGRVWNCIRGLVYICLINKDVEATWSLLHHELAQTAISDYGRATFDVLESMSHLCVAAGQMAHGTELLAAADAWRNTHGYLPTPFDQQTNTNLMIEAKAVLGVSVFNTAWRKGLAMNGEQAVAQARSVLPILSRAMKSGGGQSAISVGLTAREVDVIRLVARGLSDQQVAEKLVLSKRTVNTHLVSIYRKLGVNNREAAKRFALENGLI